MRMRTRISYDHACRACDNRFSIRYRGTIVGFLGNSFLRTFDNAQCMWTARFLHLRGGWLTVPARDHAQSKSELNCSLRVYWTTNATEIGLGIIFSDILAKFACVGVSNRLLSSIRMTITTRNWLPVCAWLACREKWLDIDVTYRFFMRLLNTFTWVYVRRFNLLLRGV